MRDLTASGKNAAKSSGVKAVIPEKPEPEKPELNEENTTEYEPEVDSEEQLEGGYQGDPEEPVITPSDDPSEAIETAGGVKLEELKEKEEIPEDAKVEDEPKVEVPPLEFATPVFRVGPNVTVRKGPKWSQFELKRGDELVIVRSGLLGKPLHKAKIISISGPRFLGEIADGQIAKEHDPACRDKAGLIKVMKDTYGKFDPKKDVVVVIEFAIV